jgi:hypothetical protein
MSTEACHSITRHLRPANRSVAGQARRAAAMDDVVRQLASTALLTPSSGQLGKRTRSTSDSTYETRSEPTRARLAVTSAAASAGSETSMQPDAAHAPATPIPPNRNLRVKLSLTMAYELPEGEVASPLRRQAPPAGDGIVPLAPDPIDPPF